MSMLQDVCNASSTALLTLLTMASCSKSEEKALSSVGTLPCGSYSWSSPKQVASVDGALAVARYPSLVVGREGPIIFGTKLEYFNREVLKDPFEAWLVDGSKRMPVPKGRWFLNPKSAADDSLLTLTWAEPDAHSMPVAAADWPPGRPQALLSAEYNSSVGWTEPEVIWSGDRLLWNDQTASPPARHNGTTVQPIVASIGRNPTRPLLAIKKPDSLFELIPIDEPGFYTSVTAAPFRNGWIVASVVTPSFDGPTAIRIARTDDDGNVTFRSRTIAATADATGELRLLVHNDTAAFLVVSGYDAKGGAVLRVIELEDDGLAMKRVSDTAMPAASGRLSATLDDCGGIVVALESWSGRRDKSSVWVFEWNRHWRDGTRPFGEINAQSVALARRGEHRIVISFLAEIRDQNGRPRLARHWSERVMVER